MVPLKSHPVVGDSQNSHIVGLDVLHHPVVENQSEIAGLSMTALVRLDLELGLSGQMRCASSGHCKSAALWVKNMEGSPSISTMESS